MLWWKRAKENRTKTAQASEEISVFRQDEIIEPECIHLRDAAQHRLEASQKEKEEVMNTDLLKKILANVAVITSVLHANGVRLGHLGEGDFIDLASQASSLIFNEIVGPPQAAPSSAPANPLIGQR
jgi:glutathionylspermidine synthase